jgi:hypothetical protein
MFNQSADVCVIVASSLQLQMAKGIADDDSLAQPQLTQLQSALDDQTKLVKDLTGKSSDVDTLKKIADSAISATGLGQGETVQFLQRR